MNNKILLIDDEPSISQALQRHLEAAGLNVEIVDNGLEGLTKLETKEYDLILLDILMPEFDGISVLTELRADIEKYGQPKVIVITNNASEDTKEKVTSLGISTFYDKGMMSASQLIETINNIMK